MNPMNPTGAYSSGWETKEAETAGSGFCSHRHRQRLLVCCAVLTSVLLIAAGLSLIIGFVVAYYQHNDMCTLSFSYVQGEVQTFEQTPAIKPVTIVNNGDLFVSSSIMGPCITAFATVTADSTENAINFPYSVQKSLTAFSLEFPYVYRRCPREDVEVVLQDWNFAGPIYFSGTTSFGDITVPSFNSLPFDSLYLKTYSGNVNIAQPGCDTSVSVSSMSGNINMGPMDTVQMSLETSSGDVTLGDIQASSVSVEVETGDIILNSLSLRQQPNCWVNIQTTSGSVSISSLTLPDSGSCNINIATTTGSVSVFLANNFSGTVYLSSATGVTVWNGGVCPLGVCAEKWDSGTSQGQHSITITANTGSVTLSFLQDSQEETE